MPYATRSQASRAACRKNLDIMQAPHAPPKRCRKPNCKKHGSASISQSTLITLNSKRSSVITKEAKAEMAVGSQVEHFRLKRVVVLYAVK